MDVRCPQCQTLYELDDQQVAKRAVTLKCSQCQHVFRFMRTVSSEENERRWMVRRKGQGDILYLDSFDLLHDWIMKRKITDADEISRTGQKWATLGEIGEFQPMFQVVASIAALGADPSESAILTRRRDTPASPPATDRARHRERVSTSLQFGGAGTPPPSEAQRTEDVTKKVRATDVLPDEVAAELEQAADTIEDAMLFAGGDDDDLAMRPTTQQAARASLETADISRERRPEERARAAPQQSSGIGIWIVLGAVAVGGLAYVALFQEESFLRDERDVVTIGGETTGATEPEEKPRTTDPRKLVDGAVAAALEAARTENDGIWTMWHETASRPFYVALDIAYTEADKATAGVELEQEIREARRALENGRLQQAQRAFRDILDRDPGNAGAVSGLGWALLELGRAKEASDEFRRSIELDKDHGDAYIGLGTAYRQLGQLEDAYQAYDRYLGLFPKGPKASIASYQMKQLKAQLGM